MRKKGRNKQQLTYDYCRMQHS